MSDARERAPAGQDLKSLVRRQFARLSAEAIASGEISDEALDRLKTLSEIDAALPAPAAKPVRRWPVILLCLGLFLVPGLMISLKVPHIEIQLRVLVTELAWVQRQPGQIVDRVSLDRLSVSSFDEIRLPQTQNASARQLTEPPGTFRIPPDSAGRISFGPVQAEAETRVWLSTTDDAPVVGLSLLGADTLVTANMSGMVSIDAGGQNPTEMDFGRVRPVQISATEPRPLDLSFHFDRGPDITFPSHIMIGSLSLQRLETVVIDGKRTPRQASSIVEGEIFDETMHGKRHELRLGEWLEFDGVDGEIRSMQMTTNGIRLNYHGRVSGLSIGSRENRRSLMPSWLEWFGERHSVQLLWGAFLWILTTLFGVIKWWQRPQ